MTIAPDTTPSAPCHAARLPPATAARLDALGLVGDSPATRRLHIDHARLGPAERALVQALVKQFGGGRLLV